MDVFLLTTFVHDKSLCPVFAWCLKNLLAVVWGAQVIHWNMLMGISRLWCVLAVISFKKYLTSRMRLVISCVVWGFNGILCLHIFIFVDCRYWPMARQRLRKIVYRKEKSSSRADQSLHTLQTKEIVTLY
ncbi:unnamed protein product, partial [Mesorhabditis belari]|uniref:Uncharacterized protein n=1 Tax=Mesorhabditis belari TaxID=2138241 RepID=A0AAF3FRZ6_9BILA